MLGFNRPSKTGHEAYDWGLGPTFGLIDNVKDIDAFFVIRFHMPTFLFADCIKYSYILTAIG